MVAFMKQIYNPKLALGMSVYFLGWFGWSVLWFLLLFSAATYIQVDMSTRERLRARRKNIAQRIHNMGEIQAYKDLGKLPKDFSVNICGKETALVWVNTIISVLWPKIQKQMETLFKQDIQPRLRETLSYYNSNLENFSFGRISPGEKIPEIKNVRVHRQTDEHTLILDVKLEYKGDAFVGFSVLKIKCGVDDLELNGTVRLRCRLSGLGRMTGVEVCFLDPPKLDFDLEGAGNLLEIPLFNTYLHEAVSDVLKERLVYPNVININMVDHNKQSDYLLSHLPIPTGLVRIDDMKARNLPAKDYGILGGRVDPYCKISLGADRRITQVIKDESHPTWSGAIWFPVRNPIGQRIKFKLMDRDRTSKDDKIGEVELEIGTILDEQKRLRYPLVTSKYGRNAEFLFRGSWFGTRPASGDHGLGPAVLSVFIHTVNINKITEDCLQIKFESGDVEICSMSYVLEEETLVVEKGFMIPMESSVNEVLMSIENQRKETLIQHSFARSTYSTQPAVKTISLDNKRKITVVLCGVINYVTENIQETEFGQQHQPSTSQQRLPHLRLETAEPCSFLDLSRGPDSWRHIDSGPNSIDYAK